LQTNTFKAVSAPQLENNSSCIITDSDGNQGRVGGEFIKAAKEFGSPLTSADTLKAVRG
jgi:hypothetical protein